MSIRVHAVGLLALALLVAVLTAPAGARASGAPTLTTTSLPVGTVGQRYLAPLTAKGGTAPLTFTATGLPAGLSLSTDGVIAGTPLAASAGTVEITVQDSLGATGETPLRLAVVAPMQTVQAAPLEVTTPALPSSTVGVRYAAGFTVSGGKSAYTWSVSTGTLPRGLTLSSAGALTGAPTLPGAYAFTVTVTDAPGKRASRAYRVVVAARPRLVTATLPAGRRHHHYLKRILRSGGTAPYRWTVSSGRLPSGLRLSGAGTVYGHPRSRGSWRFTVTLTDHWKVAARRTYRLRVR